ncbi:hypothetical protein ACQJBY_037672 [Aegilops geniculata]
MATTTTTLTSTTIASPRPPAPFCGRSGWQRARRPPSSSGQGGCARPLDRVAGWVGGGIAAAFFASLERCSCVNVRTHDDLDDDEQRDSVAPLMLGNDEDDEGRGRSRRRCRGGSRRNEKGRRSGGGMGYYGDQV